MRAILVVFDAVLLCQHFCFQKATEDFPVEELIPQLVMEALDMAVLPWAAGSDVEGFYSFVLEPVLDGVGYELRAVVAADVFGHAVAFHGRLDDGDDINGPDAPGDMNGQPLAGVFVNQGQQADVAPIIGLVGDEVPAPDMVWAFGPLSLGGADAKAFHFPLLFADLESFFVPHPLDALVVDSPSFPPHDGPDPAVAVAGVLLG